MKVEKVNENVTKVGSDYWIERGPVRCNEVATKELLDDEITASHYYAGEREIVQNGKKVKAKGIDAVGKPIELGKKMDYIDWKGFSAKKTEAYYVYKLNPKNSKWGKIAAEETYEGAIGFIFDKVKETK